MDALAKEMYNIAIAFEILDYRKMIHVDWTKASGHLILDLRMDFIRKVRLVKNGYHTLDPKGSSYISVVL